MGEAVRNELQKALFDALNAADFGTLSPVIYDQVPQDAAYPFVTLGDTDLRTWPTDEETGYEGETRIYVYTQTPGYRDVNDIVDSIDAQLDRSVLILNAEGRVALLSRIISVVDKESDGKTRRARIDFRVSIGVQA